jgi:aminopeptidase N
MYSTVAGSRTPAVRGLTSMWIAALILVGVPAGAHADRLPRIAEPLHYDLQFTPDLPREQFTGEARIRVRVLAPTARFVVHAAELRIVAASVRTAGNAQVARAVVDSAAQTVTLHVPTRVAVGEAELRLAYTGTLNRELRGFYISEANGRKYAVTQLEATDARRMFPAFDEPRYKATFAISAVIDERDTAISNGPVTATTGPSAGKKTVRFATTARMSSYLVALAVGDFACTGRVVGDTPLRVCSTPAMQPLSAFALDAAAAMLTWFNDYFVIDYPFQKLDLVAIPDFAAGAMENTGAIFFREALLLVAADAALTTQKRAAMVIAHELAHQWFGNLVTMTWWDDLWLNEGFATWMETKAVAAWKPEWNVEVDELQATQRAMAIDALASTRSVRTAAETPEQIGELFDPIAYEKGAAVLRMVESYVGDQSFRAAVNAYVHEYQYDNATAADFWQLTTRVTDRPVDRIMRSFVEQPGVPLITVETACRQGDTRVSLTQERFVASGEAVEPLLWTVPICLQTRGDGPADRCELLTGQMAELTLPGCARAVMGNKSADGYYRTRHSSDALERLAIANAELAPAERLMLIADQWALLRAHRADVSMFLDLASSLALDVHAPQVVETLASRLQFVHEYVTTSNSRAGFEAWIRQQFGPALAASSRVDPLDTLGQRQLAVLMLLVGGAGADDDVREDARHRIQQYLGGTASPPQATSTEVLDALVRLAALTGDAALYDAYRQRAERAPAPEERYRFLYALAAFPDPALLRRTIDYALSDAVRTQDRAALLAAVLDNPEGRAVAWPVLQQRWEQVQDMGGFGGVVRIIDALGAFCDADAAEQIERFFVERPLPSAKRTLEQTLEDIHRCTRLRTEEAGALAAWVDRHAAAPTR